MSSESIFAVALVLISFLGLLATRLHVDLPLMLSGLLGAAVLRGLGPAVGTAANQPYSTAADY